ncbi:hypothetical protein [Niastella sp. OAS944]|uniref:hypothetical protein n=1 Tax=Niastella sp. OAS944 TaxID=2664089 RepID=UPI00348D0EA4|nr:phage shock protein PspC (stress-responsive transcriptional regulator) [Chitinophagaceae bacterium OAS944]
MPNTLTQTEKDQIRYKLTTNTFSADAEIAKLMEKGYDETEAKSLLLNEIREFKQVLFEKKMQQNKQGEVESIAVGVTVMFTLIGPLFGITSPVWFMVAFLAAGIGGYFAAQDKPIAGIAGGIVYGIIFPLAHHMYFADRTRFIRIEMVIPIIMAMIPAFILYFILAKTVYAKSDKESYDY